MPSLVEISQPVHKHFDDVAKLLPPQPAGLPLSRKNIYYGIEVLNSIVWQGWEPGREYTKNIVLKNVNVKTQKIKYKGPNSRFFTTMYPKPVVLSAGTSFSLPVTFRPLEKVVYEDKIEFHTKDGSFDVPIRSILPEVDISIPEVIDFNMCATKDIVETSFEVCNTGDLETQVEWRCSEPFTISPMCAILKSKTTKTFKATFKPVSASVYEAQAVCVYGPDYSKGKVTRLHGIGKYPHILISNPGKPATSLSKDNLEAVLSFGPTPVGCTVQKWVELHNLAPVKAPYRVEHPSKSRIDTVFKCPQKTGVVPPLSSVKIPITYSPNIVDSTSIDYFNVYAIGNVSKSVIKCSGSSKGPTVQLSSKVVNFMQIDLGETATRTIDVINDSDVEAVYQFMIDCKESVFKLDKISGVLRPKTKTTIIMTFAPQHPINYHRQVTCMVHNQGPLFLDLLGTCHAEMTKPAVLLARHLERYQVHVARGLSLTPPEQLNEQLKVGLLELDDAGCLMMPEHIGQDQSTLPDPDPMDEFFNDGFHSDIVKFVPHVSLDVNTVDFGVCQNLRVIEDKIINITNHTKGKVTVQWSGGSDRTFHVTPSVMDIPPLKSCTFQVTFRPNAPNQFFGAELECYTYYKSLRDYRLVEDKTHFPSWCSTITCTGHTFQPNNETFLPRFTVDSPRIIFPAVNAKESTYRTVLLTNTGTTPIFFDIQKDDTNTFAVKPVKSLMKGEHQIFVIKITPREVQTYQHNLCVRLNDNEKYNKEIQLLGSAEAPNVLLDTEGNMFFKQTCVGTSSQKSYAIKNLSRIPLRFEWRLKHQDRKLLKVQPDAGIIQPNESQVQMWSFVPDTEKKFVMKPTLIVWGQGFTSSSSGGKKKQFTVRAIGEGTLGDIKADQSYVDFGDVVVGSSAAKEITISNHSSCSLHYRLFIDQTLDGPYPEEITQDDKIALLLETTEGVLPAHSKKTIRATVKPLRRVTYQFAISYQLLTPEGSVQHSAAQEPQHLCHVLTTGVFPFMAVTDARCYGSAIGISKRQLWNLFSLDNLNVSLDADPSHEELRYSVATRHSHARRPPVYTRAIMDFNFSAAPLGSEPCVVNLMFENPGTVATEWAFLFPTDLQLELEYWAETGEFDEDELHEMKVMDNKLFTIEPKRGYLEPGECKTVVLKYHHTMAGTDRLPVLLKLARGREVLLNFIGVTVEPGKNYVHFSSNKHMFTPVAVGEKTPPKQIYELYNGGAKPVRYTIDTTPLHILQQENFDQKILECLEPTNVINPGESCAVQWLFSPIEAKTYMVDVPIKIEDDETAIVTFTGVGFDKQALGDTMPISDQQDMTGVPSIQSADVPGQLAYLSRERIAYGNVPLFSRSRRMVFVCNRSKERAVTFQWHLTSRSDQEYISVSPWQGRLEPGESRMCRIIFVASSQQPSFYDMDLVCEVKDETEMEKYHSQLGAWQREQERQAVEFTITEHDLDADKRISQRVEFTESPSGINDPVVGEGELSRYKTLPPIKKLSPDEEKALGKMKKKKQEGIWEKPKAPPPFILHLGLTARTHDIREFQVNFPEEYQNFQIDRTIMVAGKPTETTPQVESIQCTGAEADVISSIMSNVLRGLLDDTTFHDAINKVVKEPIPYYSQIGEHRTPQRPPPTESPSGTPRESRLSMISSSDVTLERASAPPTPYSLMPSPKVVHPTESPREDNISLQYTSLEELERVKQEETKMREMQALKKLPEFGKTAESIMENTLSNIISEALSEEFNITARPRFIALPRRTASAQSRNTK